MASAAPRAVLAGALLLAPLPALPQENAPPGAGRTAGPLGAPAGGGSLGDPLTPFGGVAPGRSAPTAPDAAPAAAPTGSPVRLGAFGAPFAAAPAATAAEDPGRAWSIVPSIGIDIGATDNVFRTRSDRRADIFTNIQPGILIDGATQRLRATISYTPTATAYATYTSQNRLSHIGSGQILAELVPDALFLDIRGAASLGTTTGGVLPSTVATAPRNDLVQTYNFQLSPYYVQRFGTTATAQIGYVFQFSAQEGTTQFQPGFASPSFVNQDYTAHRGYLVVRSGEDFGRLALQARVDGTTFVGTGIYDGAHAFVTALEARYAITPTIAVLLEGGYEDIEYGGTNPDKIQDAIWSVGARLTPTPDSYLVARYGRRGGFESPSVEAGIQLGGFTRLTASYAERLSTSAIAAQDLLATTTLDALGNPVDIRSGAPVLYANGFFPAQSGLFRTQNGQVSITQSWPRDSITLSAFYQHQDPVSAAPGVQLVESTGYYGGISWTRELSPVTALTTGVQLGRTENADQPSTDVIAATGALSHQINDRLSGVVRFIYTSQSSSRAQNEYSQSIILAAIRQTF